MIAWVRLVVGGTVLVLVGLVSGCGGYQQLLSGQGRPSHAMQVTARFADVLNLEPGAPVKREGVVVGRVTAVHLDGSVPVVTLSLDADLRITEDARARLRYDTPLGEVFVDLAGSSRGPLLRGGDVLAPERTSTAPTVEDTLAQASLLINGGGLGQIQTITRELNLALGGREDDVRDTVETTRTLLRQINSTQPELRQMLRGLASTAGVLERRRATLRDAIRSLGPAAEVLRAQEPALRRVLVRSEQVVGDADALLATSERDLLTILDRLGPTLEAVLASKDALVASLTDVQRAARRLDEAIPAEAIPLDAILRLSSELLTGGSR